MKRCQWADGKFPEYQRYHDEEWGVPVHDDRILFEFLMLEGAQAGLSWETVLKKRSGYARLFHQFDPEQVAAMSDTALERCLQDSSIIRNRLKVFGARRNAIAFLEIQQEFGSFDAYLWRFVNGRPVQNQWSSLAQVPVSTAVSDALSRDLKKRGMTFVGTTIMYAYMQAMGLVNDHTVDCFRYHECSKSGS